MHITRLKMSTSLFKSCFEKHFSFPIAVIPPHLVLSSVVYRFLARSSEKSNDSKEIKWTCVLGHSRHVSNVLCA